MRQSVRDVFFDFTVGHEGFTPYMYADTLNLVTTGVGNLIDAGRNVPETASNPPLTSAERARANDEVSAAAMAPAMRLPWRTRAPGWSSKNPLAGDLVSPSEISDAWIKVKKQNQVVPNFSQRGGGAYAGLTNITLDMQGLKELFDNTLNNFDNTLAKQYPGYNNWPADAQLATLSMAWAMGPAFGPKFPQFSAAVNAKDFRKAAELSFFRGGGGTLSKRSGRNAENQQMFLNAANVIERGADFNQLIFPGAEIPTSMISGPFKNVTDLAIPTIVGLGAVGIGYFTWKKYREKS